MSDAPVTLTRRAWLTAAAATLAAPSAPAIIRQPSVSLRFRTIPDPDGWHPSLRLKGDWLVIELDDGVWSGFGEASHSRDDARCRRVAETMFARYYEGVPLSVDRVRRIETEAARLRPDFVTATALSGLNQAAYDLLAKREQVPVWRLLTDTPGLDRLALYTTINRALKTRSPDEYVDLVGTVTDQGFRTIKCAPFERVQGPERAVERAADGLATLDRLRRTFADLAIRVDFHERFVPPDFFELLPALERLDLDWLEEPFARGPALAELKRRTRLRVAGGELFWGTPIFEELTASGWVDVIMPDVKHVGGFGPLIRVLEMGRGRIEISPHNPSGPISTAASLHAAAVAPQTVRSLEYAFDTAGTRAATGETVDGGVLYLTARPGWGVEPPAV